MPTQIEQDILKELGIDSLPPERQEEVLTAMTEAVLKRIILRLVETLADEKRTQLEEVGHSGDSAKISQFLADNIPNYEELVREEAVKFKKDMQIMVDGLLA
ncbi:MAG: hypothetical protein UW11_C0016G0009 [Parcubacteria group bacterium GW2011_GWA2_43_9b]|uniref:Uncharacterized protein n=1 Tax=Candidatus Portnoybacteria bacterium RIFCSPLOWO2_02_FULL_39_11 TaxID=1802001 RepID=A0A1G2FWT9_9BACT|nr:MAG: hypothetical protein UW11_C0016G0009 [Parcubacteria group bacterium GW2011_GWA2_43_9b]OGZ42182.1 MAG: hypothetical protein A3B04_00930 [Candidatus Portnoybacteria bacterium RIFCSPLOWO2_02_FULL_39_11]